MIVGICKKNKEMFEKYKEKVWNVECYVCGKNHLANKCPKRYGKEAANRAKEEGGDELSL